MKANGRAMVALFAIPVVGVGLFFSSMVFMGRPYEERPVSLAASNGSARLERVLISLEEEIDVEAMDEEDEPGFGYVEAVPDDQPPTLDAQEKAEAMEGASVAARLGAGWGQGEMMSEDLRLLVQTARSQLSLYSDELDRMGRDGNVPPAELERAREALVEARQRLEGFSTVGDSLRRAMTELQGAFQNIDEAVQAQR